MKIDMDENDLYFYKMLNDVFNNQVKEYLFFFYFSLFIFFIKFIICLIIFLLSKKKYIYKIIKITEHKKIRHS